MKYIQKFEKFNINSDYFLLRKIIKDVKLDFYSILKYQLAIININLIISKLINNESNYNTLLLTICAISILTRENKDKIKTLFNFALEKGITEEEINDVINKINLLLELFTSVAKQFDKNISTVNKMIRNISILIPFLSVLKDLINNELVDVQWFNNGSDNLKKSIGLDKYKRIIERLMHKIIIIISSTDKFQNVENVKPLLAQDELKSPMYKKIKPYI